MKDDSFTGAVQNAGLVHQVFVRCEKCVFFQQKSLCSLGTVLHTHAHTLLIFHQSMASLDILIMANDREALNGPAEFFPL